MTIINNLTSGLTSNLISNLTLITVTPFNPITSGLVVQVAGFQIGLTKSQLVTVDGLDEVLNWLDYSGNNNDIPEVIDNPRPTYTLNSINGHPSVVCIGAQLEHLRNTGFAEGILIQPNTIFLVWEATAFNGNFEKLLDGGGSLGERHVLQVNVIGSNEMTMFAGSSVTGSDSLALNTPYIHTAMFDGASSQLYRNGILRATGDAGTQPLNGITVGSSRTGGTDNADAKMGELLIYNRRLSLSEIEEVVRSYLSPKWGIPLV